MATIKVTQEHINHGQLESCYHCPVALAVNEVLAPGYGCTAGPPSINIYKRIEDSDYAAPFHYEMLQGIGTPPVASRFMRHFEQGIAAAIPSPFEFELPIHTQYLRNPETTDVQAD